MYNQDNTLAGRIAECEVITVKIQDLTRDMNDRIACAGRYWQEDPATVLAVTQMRDDIEVLNDTAIGYFEDCDADDTREAEYDAWAEATWVHYEQEGRILEALDTISDELA